MRTHVGLLAAVLTLALALRLAPWGDNRFLEDEALYTAWGLQIATGADPMLDYEPVDKPPFHPYALAFSLLLFGSPTTADVARNESAARLPSLFASVASVALVYALGRQLYGDVRVGLLAALLLALSPFDILFASTAFTDPLMVALVLGALLAAAKGRLGLAGLLVGLSAATKQQGLLFLPLVVAIGVVGSGRSSRSILAWLRFVAAFAAVAGAAFWWDAARVQRPGFWTQGLVSYGSLGLAGPEVWAERAHDWLRLTADFWVSPWFNGPLVLVLVAWTIVSLRAARGLRPKPREILRFAQNGNGPENPGSEIIDRRPSAVDLILIVFVIGFLVLHWLLTFQVWDRYLLGLVPIVALLTARAVVGLGQAIRSRSWRMAYAAAVGLVMLASLVGPVSRAARSGLPLGGDHGAYDGIDRLADYVRANVPPGAVLYHHWLGYHYRFYMYGTPLRLHWYPDPADLVQDAVAYRLEPRYIAFPSFRDGVPMQAALNNAGIQLLPVYETTRRDGTVSFRLYRLEGP
jgi:4-amino-4-deoxy-L-arabinose transferase-like glycosyltransferase